jgi:hypothetical protein
VRRESAKTPKGKITAKAESQVLAKVYADRFALYVCNPSTKSVWLALGETAAKEEGIFLAKETGTTVIEGYTGVVSVVTTEGEGVVTFSEI